MSKEDEKFAPRRQRSTPPPKLEHASGNPNEKTAYPDEVVQEIDRIVEHNERGLG